MLVFLVSAAAVATDTQAGFLLPGALPAPAGSASAGAFVGTAGDRGWAGLEGSFAPTDRTAFVGFVATPLGEQDVDLGFLLGARVLAWDEEWVRVAPLVVASGRADVDHGNQLTFGLDAGLAIDVGTRHVRIDGSTTVVGLAVSRTEWTVVDEPALVAVYAVGPRFTEVGLRAITRSGKSSWRIAGPTPVLSYRYAGPHVFIDLAVGWVAVGLAGGARF